MTKRNPSFGQRNVAAEPALKMQEKNNYAEPAEAFSTQLAGNSKYKKIKHKSGLVLFPLLPLIGFLQTSNKWFRWFRSAPRTLAGKGGAQCP